MFRISRRKVISPLALIVAAAIGGALQVPDPAGAQDAYPSRPVTIVLPFGAGGVGDVTARLAAEELGKALGQRFVIDNRPGAGGIVAARTVTGAKPDGYTLGLVANGTAISVAMFNSLPIDPVDQFEMISLMGTFELVVIASADSPYATLQDFLQAAKARPGTLNVGTISVGSGQNLTAELLKMQADVDFQIIPHRTSGEVTTSLLRGDIQVAVEIPAAVRGLVRDKKVRAIATTGAKRSQAPEFKDAPTVRESGLAGFEVVSWNGFFAPKGTPSDIIAKLNGALRGILANPAIEKRYLELGVEAASSSPAELKQRLVDDIRKWSAVVEKARIPKQ